MHRIGKAGGLGDLVEREAGIDQERLSAPDAAAKLPAIWRHPGRGLECPVEVRLRQSG